MARAAVYDLSISRPKIWITNALSGDFRTRDLIYHFAYVNSRDTDVPLASTPHWSSSSFTNAAMDITKYVVEYREAAFLLGDYSTYRAQLTRRLRIVQKKLGRSTPKNAKYAAKAPVTAEDIAKNIECV